ncbi:hypothetical protein ACP4OV_017055 [Aristida adscensionis]
MASSSSPREEGGGMKKKTTAMVVRRVEAEQAHAAALRGRYSLQSVRGMGTFAEVWEARHRRTGLRVAVKILSLAKLQQLQVPARKVEREVSVMRRLRCHPHIVRFHEAFVSGAGAGAAGGGGGEHVYIVMELAEQGQLHDYVSIRGRLPEGEARRIFRQVAAGVGYCHRNMVVHRDLKMENVLMDARGDVKIVDFGFAKFFIHGQFLSSCCGSPAYAAPELHERRKYIGPQVDVWSLGVILYGMVCGCLPFDDADMSQLKRSIRRGEFRLPPFVSDGAGDLIRSMLIVKPDKRLTMAEVAAHPWLQPAAGVPAYLALPPLDAHTYPFMQIDDETVDLVVARHGFNRIRLLDSLHRGIENEETVTYDLTLSSRIDAATRYLWAILPPRHATAIAGPSCCCCGGGGAAMDPAALDHRAPASDMPLQQQLQLPPGAEASQATGGGGEGSGQGGGGGGGGGGGRRPWSLAGVDVLRECPRETMRHVAQALRELGVHFHSSSCSGRHRHHQDQPPGRHRRRHHRMVCAHFPRGAAVPGGAAAISDLLLLLTSNDDSQPEPIGSTARATAASSSSLSGQAAPGTTNGGDIPGSLSAAVLFEIELHDAGEGEGRQEQCVLELRRVSGPQLHYLRICKQLASRLKAATQ